MKIMIKNVGEFPKTAVIRDSIKGSLEDIRDIIGGHLEFVLMNDTGLALICNEEGKLKGLPVNFHMEDEPINGNVCFVNTYREDIIDITDEQIGYIYKVFQKE